jgi:hypothetical protein
VGGTCSTVREMKKSTFWLESLKRSDHSEDVSVDGRIILKWITRK